MAEAFEEIEENFEGELEERMDGNTAAFLNEALRTGADLYERTCRRLDYFSDSLNLERHRFHGDRTCMVHPHRAELR